MRAGCHDSRASACSMRQVELGEGQRQRRLEAEHPGRRLVERLLLGLLGVGGVVGGDGVEGAVGQAGPHRGDVGRRCAAAG